MLAIDVQSAARSAGYEVIAWNRAELDITDREAVCRVIAAAAPDVVVNCAAYTAVDAAEGEGRGAAAEINELGAGNVAEATSAAEAWLMHVSTDYVFDGTKMTGPYVESDPPAPASVYGATKLAGEAAVARWAPASHTIVRTSWLFANHGACFPATILGLAAQRDQLSVVDDQRGCPTYTPDLASALLDLAGTRRRMLGVVHLAGGGECSWFEFAQAILQRAGVHTSLRPCASEDFPRPALRPAYSVLRTERGEKVPVLRDWRQSVREYLDLRGLATA